MQETFIIMETIGLNISINVPRIPVKNSGRERKHPDPKTIKIAKHFISSYGRVLLKK